MREEKQLRHLRGRLKHTYDDGDGEEEEDEGRAGRGVEHKYGLVQFYHHKDNKYKNINKSHCSELILTH